MYSDPRVPKLDGRLLAGKYRVTGQLGSGGMGFVLAAHHEQLNRPVALKFLLPDCAQNPEAAARFQREARAAARIHSEHVVRILDVGEIEGIGPFMVMEYLEGQDLAGVLQRQGRLSVSEAVEYVLQACEAVAEAHAAGIVHRDLKPANLFLTHHADGAPLVKVCDFGIAKAGGSEAQGLTYTNAFVGSPNYSAPEQLLASFSVDARADIWALGVILFELLSGQLPFFGRSVPELASNILTQRAPDIRSVRPDIPAALASLLAACLEREPAHRVPNVGMLAHALLQFAPASAQASARRISRVLGLEDKQLGARASASNSDASAATSPGTSPLERSSDARSAAVGPGGAPVRTSVSRPDAQRLGGESAPPGHTLAAATDRAPTPGFNPAGSVTVNPQSISVSTPPARPRARLSVGGLTTGLLIVPALVGSAWWALRTLPSHPPAAPSSGASSPPAFEQKPSNTGESETRGPLVAPLEVRPSEPVAVPAPPDDGRAAGPTGSAHSTRAEVPSSRASASTRSSAVVQAASASAQRLPRPPGNGSLDRPSPNRSGSPSTPAPAEDTNPLDMSLK